MNMPSILSLAVAGLLVAPVHAATAPSEPFQPPAESSLPDNAFGEMVRQGQALFVETRKNAPHLVGNQLNCVNCHLDQAAGPTPRRSGRPTRSIRRSVPRTTRSIRSPSACRAASSSA